MIYFIIGYLVVLCFLLFIGKTMKNIDDSLKSLIDMEDDK